MAEAEVDLRPAVGSRVIVVDPGVDGIAVAGFGPVTGVVLPDSRDAKHRVIVRTDRCSHSGLRDWSVAVGNVHLSAEADGTGLAVDAPPSPPPPPAHEAVDHPPHYGGAENPYETIKVLAAWMPSEQLEGFVLGNAIKYLSRAGKKGAALEDARKARWYLNYWINLLEQKR